MKFCEKCGVEVDTKDGENLCRECDDAEANGKRIAGAKARRREREEALKSLGLVKVRGALGGTYWE